MYVSVNCAEQRCFYDSRKGERSAFAVGGETGNMSEIPYKTVIFDLDGTLLDTLQDLADAVNASLMQFGYPTRSIDEVRAFVGNGIRLLMIRALPGGDENPDFPAVFQAFRDYYARHCFDHTCPYPGIEQLLSALREKGCRTAVVSNKADTAVKALCSRFFPETIDIAIGERESAGIRKKPAPDTVFEVLRLLDAKKESAVYIGDSDVDIMTAVHAGLPCISVTWGFRDKAFLAQNGATQYASSPQELRKLLLPEMTI